MENITKSHTIDGFEEERRAILAECLVLAPFDGWTAGMLRNAAITAEVDPAAVRAAFPKGVSDVLRFWSGEADRAMVGAMAAPGFAEKRIRDKVADAVLARIEALAPHKEAARRAAAYLAAPPLSPFEGPPLAAKLAWTSADAIWRGLGDKSTDFNFYSKRAILSGVLVSTMARWLADDSADGAATDAFLAARIENVMQIEKAKAQVRKLGIDPVAPIGWLARLRYPAGH
jgi:ubiquinone biosynthesis protein COQ9